MNSSNSELIQMIEHLMYGHNYQVTIGHELLNANSPESAAGEMKSIFPDCDPSQVTKVEPEDLWEEIHHGFDYRGDQSSGLILSSDNEIKLKALQKTYIETIDSAISAESMIVHLVSYKGIPGYPVYWDYRFIIINRSGSSCFAYGSSSD